MKALYLLFIATTFLFASQKYKISQDNYDEYGDKGTISNLYIARSDKALLSFTAYEKSGGCGRRDYQEAVYDLNESKITIYTKWSGYSVKGYRKMVYSLEDGTSAKLISSHIYVLDERGEDSLQDIKYLKNGVKDAHEKKLLDEYISSTQKAYKGKFVFKKDKEELIAEVNGAFQSRLFHY